MTSQPIEQYFPLVEHRLKPRPYPIEQAICNWLSRRMFADIQVSGLEPLLAQRRAEAAQGDQTVNIYIARHLGEFDWQEIQRCLTAHRIPAAVQAGDNLFIGPLDPLLRHLGGFKVFREEARLYAGSWLRNAFRKAGARLHARAGFKQLLALLGVRPQPAIVVDAALARDIYTAYMQHLINVEGRDILVFPEYTKTVDKKTKYGRSYSGHLLDFTPLLFRLFKDLNKKTGRRLQLVPVNVSYERIVEDQTFQRLEQIKANARTRRFTYLVDYFFNYTHWIYQRRTARVKLAFGAPVPLRKKMDFKLRLHEDLRKRVGALQAVFPTQVLGYAMREDRTLTATILYERVARLLAALERTEADISALDGLSPAQIVDQAYALFDQHPKRRIIRRTRADGTYRVLRPDVLSQYGNHIAHLFERWHDVEHLKKMLGFIWGENTPEQY